MNIQHSKSSKRKTSGSGVVVKKIKQEPQEQRFAFDSESEGAVKVDDELTVWFENGIKEEKEIIVKIGPSEEKCNATIQSKKRNHNHFNLTKKLVVFMPPDLKKLMKEC